LAGSVLSQVNPKHQSGSKLEDIASDVLNSTKIMTLLKVLLEVFYHSQIKTGSGI